LTEMAAAVSVSCSNIAATVVFVCTNDTKALSALYSLLYFAVWSVVTAVVGREVLVGLT
jgi:hypothetical protein